MTNSNTFSSGFFGGRSVYFPKAVTLKSIKMMIRGTAAGCTVTPAVYAVTSGGVEGALVAQGPSVVGVSPGLLNLPLTADYPVAAGTMLIVGVIALGLPCPSLSREWPRRFTTPPRQALRPAHRRSPKALRTGPPCGLLLRTLRPAEAQPAAGSGFLSSSPRLLRLRKPFPSSLPTCRSRFREFRGRAVRQRRDAPAATFTITINKNGSPIGTITISTAGAVTLATTGGLAQNVAAGDKITFVAQASVDASIANVAGMLWGNETA